MVVRHKERCIGMACSRSTNRRFLAVLSALALTGPACNPSFLALVDPTFVPLPRPAPGFVVIAFENDTNVTCRLRVEIQTAEGVQEINFGERFDDPLTSGVSPDQADLRALECEGPPESVYIH